MVPHETGHSAAMQTSQTGCSFSDDSGFPRIVSGFGYEFCPLLFVLIAPIVMLYPSRTQNSRSNQSYRP